MTGVARYPTYTAHNRVTFDELPDHWDVVRGRHIVRIQTGSGDTVDAMPEGEYPFYVRSDTPLRSDNWEFDTTAVLTAGDGAGVAKVFHLVSGRFMAHQRVYVLDGFQRVRPKFFFYAFSSMFRLMALDGSARSTVDSVRRAMIADMAFPVPPDEEQRAIADFLDRETARIDTLIEEQRQLIKLLRERRAGVIADAVTQGVDGNAPGSKQIGWLGPTPAHWRTGRVKHLGNVTLGKMLQASDSGSDVRAPYMRAANVQPDGALLEDDVKEMWFSVDELASLDLRRGDVVVVEGGVGGYGRAAYLDHDLRGWGFQNSINRIRPHQETDGRYLAYFLIMARNKGFIEAYCNVVSMPHLTAEKLNAMAVPIPPFDEQQRIATYLDDQTSKIDALIAEGEKFIELASERRSALITAAVTGQIDVREAA